MCVIGESAPEPEPEASAMRPKLDRRLAERLPLAILVAEDNPVNQKLMLHVLRQMGYEPDMVGNGAEVLSALQRRAYDLVFMDIEMPEMDGFEATRRIRSSVPDRQPTIIGTTAYAEEEDRKQCLEAGMDDYLSKPIRIEGIQAILERWGPRVADKSPAAAVEPLVEAGRITELGAMGPTLLQQLVDLYLEDFPVLLASMQQGLHNEDRGQLLQAAHGLKGSSVNLGIAFVSERCRKIEELARTNSIGAIRPLLDQIESRWGDLQATLNDLESHGT
jgi:CheY-like chemotaxis protein/HPt (histidine-containing phosphotransfer) domain-containing protein